MKKKNNSPYYIPLKLKSILHFTELLIEGKLYNKINRSQNLSILHILANRRTLNFPLHHIRKNAFIVLIKLLALKNINGSLRKKMYKEIKHLDFHHFPNRRLKRGGNNKVTKRRRKRRRKIVSKSLNK